MNQHIQKKIDEFRKKLSTYIWDGGFIDDDNDSLREDYMQAFFKTSLEKIWKEAEKIILQEIQDSSFEILFGKYLEHDDAHLAAEEIRALIKKQLTLKQTT